MAEQIKITRDGKVAYIVLRNDEAQAATRKGTIKWGSGKVWQVVR